MSELETEVQRQVRLEAARLGIYLWRNNIGAATLENGSFVRWGLANDSSNVNSVMKSGDLIGVRRRIITQADVGRSFGQFVSRECKRENWIYTGTEAEVAQKKWRDLIRAAGGDAEFATGLGTF